MAHERPCARIKKGTGFSLIQYKQNKMKIKTTRTYKMRLCHNFTNLTLLILLKNYNPKRKQLKIINKELLMPS